MTLVPCGLDFARFAPPAGREALRERYGVGASTFVVLAVTAVKRDHKRVDHLIDEVASLEGDVLLWLDGNPEDDAVLEHGKRVLGPRLRVTHVASSEVPELYGLADVLVHASLEESFGLAIVEAISSGLPVRVHDNPHFRWLTGDPDCMVAMDRPGALAASLRALRGMPRPGPARAAAIRERFDWSVVAPAYLEMYRRLA
jgi:glycosyltransferase involved in cell wall biosynthesis